MTIDHTKPEPGEPWVFDGAVAGVFDDMLKRSIPDYDTMRELVLAYGSRLVQDGTAVIDYGCSLGESLAPFVNRFGARARFIGLDNSPAMVAAAQERFGSLAIIREADLVSYFPPMPVSLTLAIFALQFVPIEHRWAVLRRIHNATLPGGGLVLAEKVLGSDWAAQTALVDEYHAMKARHGYSADEIDAKARSLRGVLVPLTVQENERALRAAGFEHVEMIWRAHNFAAWVAAREP